MEGAVGIPRQAEPITIGLNPCVPTTTIFHTDLSLGLASLFAGRKPITLLKTLRPIRFAQAVGAPPNRHVD